MIKTLFTLPKNLDLAFSGGIDSLCIAHFLSKTRKNLRLLHFNHGCPYSDTIENECRKKADELNLNIIVHHIEGEKQEKQSQEEFWRDERYKFLKSSSNYVMTAHHLDDAMETWLWSSLHGQGKIIPFQNQNIIRPFLLTQKKDFKDYAENHHLIEVDDPFNRDEHVMRNYMRKHIIPHALHINPGLYKVIRKKYLSLDIQLEPLDLLFKQNTDYKTGHHLNKMNCT